MRSLSVVLITLYVGFNSCNASKEKRDKTYDNFLTQRIEYRDSIFIMYTIKQWVDSDSPGFHTYSDIYQMSNDQIQYFIGGAFYSPDKKKIIIWIIDVKPNVATRKIYNEKDSNVNKLCAVSSKIVYGGTAVIGFRNDTNHIWNLYPFDSYTADCYFSKSEVISLMGQYYFEAMEKSCPYVVNIKYVDTIKYNGRIRWDLEKQSADYGLNKGEPDSLRNYQLEDFGYNLQDKDFWDRSLIWEKGTQIKGHYLFQLSGNGITSDTLKMPKVNYPDSILKLYTTAK